MTGLISQAPVKPDYASAENGIHSIKGRYEEASKQWLLLAVCCLSRATTAG